MRTTFLGLMTALWMTGCGGDDGAGPRGDAGPDAAVDAPPPCLADDECDDGLFCNGAERCAPGTTGAGADGCVAGEPELCDDADECTVDTCDEDTQDCRNAARDLDADGHGDRACGGDDCDDDDPMAFPGNDEICDADDRDEDCNPATFGRVDLD